MSQLRSEIQQHREALIRNCNIILENWKSAIYLVELYMMLQIVAMDMECYRGVETAWARDKCLNSHSDYGTLTKERFWLDLCKLRVRCNRWWYSQQVEHILLWCSSLPTSLGHHVSMTSDFQTTTVVTSVSHSQVQTPKKRKSHPDDKTNSILDNQWGWMNIVVPYLSKLLSWSDIISFSCDRRARTGDVADTKRPATEITCMPTT